MKKRTKKNRDSREEFEKKKNQIDTIRHELQKSSRIREEDSTKDLKC